MKKYQKKSQLSEQTNMGFKTMSDDFHIDEVNAALSQVQGLGFELPGNFSKKPVTIKGGGNASLRIEDINESVSRITNGMDGLFESSRPQQQKKKLNESSSENQFVDEKKWHEVFQAMGHAIDSVSKPAWGEWGNILSVPERHVKVYDQITKLMPELLSLTAPGTNLWDTVDTAMNRFAMRMKRQAEILYKKYKDELNSSDSEGFEMMQRLHGEFNARVMNPIARARH